MSAFWSVAAWVPCSTRLEITMNIVPEIFDKGVVPRESTRNDTRIVRWIVSELWGTGVGGSAILNLTTGDAWEVSTKSFKRIPRGIADVVFKPGKGTMNVGVETPVPINKPLQAAKALKSRGMVVEMSERISRALFIGIMEWIISTFENLTAKYTAIQDAKLIKETLKIMDTQSLGIYRMADPDALPLPNISNRKIKILNKSGKRRARGTKVTRIRGWSRR